MPCSSGCPTPGAHATWGQCLRSKQLQVAGVEAHARNVRQNAALNNYVDARKAGLQPDGVFPRQVREAWRETERTGSPYRADIPPTQER